MKQLNALTKNRVIFLSITLLTLFTPALAQQNSGEDFYLLKKDWSIAKNIEESTYFMQAFKQNDTNYTCWYYNKAGSMLRQEVFSDEDFTISNGRFCWYDKNGNLDSTGWVVKGKKNGRWDYYNDSLKIIKTEAYNNGHFTGNTENNFPEAKETELINAGFGTSGSDEEWNAYLEKMIKVPQRFLHTFEPGVYPATVSFTVNTEGSVTDIYLLHSCEWSADAELFNAVQKSPGWQAAEKAGNKVATHKEQSVTFQSTYIIDDSTAKQESSFFIGLREPATFNGGAKCWQNFLARKLNPLVAVNNNAPDGVYTVVISFLVQKDGTVGEINALTNPGYGTAEEAIKVFKKSPKWIPATQNGEPVNYRQKQLLTFSVSKQ